MRREFLGIIMSAAVLGPAFMGASAQAQSAVEGEKLAFDRSKGQLPHMPRD